MKLLVLGAGAWGTALAAAASARHDTALWSRDLAFARQLREQRANARYLPGVALPPSISIVTGDPAAAAAGFDLLVVATPMAGLRPMLASLREAKMPVAWACKGLEAAGVQALLGHEIQQAVAPGLAGGVLTGPSFALEVARGQPTALVAASPHLAVRQALVQAFHTPQLRVYENDDLPGAEVGGAVKNVLAIATGLCDGLGLGLNARAALVTRGLAEMTRFGIALGGRAETFMGLSGLGDLVLTATGDLSRNRRVGLQLAQGQPLEQVLASLGHVAEGVPCARAVAARAALLRVEMPITEAVVALLDGRLRPDEAVRGLMARDPVSEKSS